MFIIHTKCSAEEEVSKRFSVRMFFHVFKQPIRELAVSIYLKSPHKIVSISLFDLSSVALYAP